MVDAINRALFFTSMSMGTVNNNNDNSMFKVYTYVLVLNLILMTSPIRLAIGPRSV